MPDPLPDWVDEERPTPPSTGRRAALLALAALPWLVVLALVLAPDAPRDTTSPAHVEAHVDGHRDGDPESGPVPEARDGEPLPADLDAPAPHELDASGAHDDGPGPGPPTPRGWEVTTMQGAWRVAPGDGETAALATAVARAWLTGVPPVLTIEGLSPPHSTAYAEHLVVEAIERPAAGAAVVTVLAVLLDTDDGGAIGDGRVARLAVPIVEDGHGPRPGGIPWPLPGPELSLTVPTTDEVTDPALREAASEALRRAGYEGAVLLALGVGDGWPWVARFRPADGTDPSTVWLRRHLDGFAVAGLPLRPAVSDPDPDHDPDPDAADAGTDEIEEVAP